MSELNAKIKDLKTKTQKLINLHQVLRLENEGLKADLVRLEKEKDQQSKRIKELEEKQRLIKLAKSLKEVDPDTREVKWKINEMLREIDKCLAQLTGN